MTGLRIGRWTVIKQAPNRCGTTAWLCACDCGTIRAVLANSLRMRKSLSCGCLGAEKTSARNYKHGKANSGRLYRIWKCMHSRCNNPNNPSYKNYGGRGITICSLWNDFVEFETWSVHNGYSELKSIDRIDNDKGYYPENCRWATKMEQCNNTRRDRKIETASGVMTIAQLSRITGIDRKKLTRGLNRKESQEVMVL